MNHTAHVCKCVPEYVPNIREVLNTTLKACNFYEHATCVTYVKDYFETNSTECKPECLNSEYTQTGIQVIHPVSSTESESKFSRV